MSTKQDILRAERKILDIIDRSPVPEDPAHARNTAQWVERLGSSDPFLRLAALGHDIERALPEEKVKREQFTSFDDFKEAHAKNSARVLRKILADSGLEPEEIDKICYLVEMHERGGSPEADLLKEADALSFFETNLALYSLRHTEEDVEKRALWGLRRLRPATRDLVLTMDYKDPHLSQMVRRLIREMNKGSRPLKGEERKVRT